MAYHLPTYTVRNTPGSISSGQYPTAILNRDSNSVIRIWRANVYTAITTAVTGSILRFLFNKFTRTTALGLGTALTAVAHDSDDALPSAIDLVQNPTGVFDTEATIKSLQFSADEPDLTTLDADAFSSYVFARDINAAYIPALYPFLKPVTLRTDGTTFEGFGMKLNAGTPGASIVTFEITFSVSSD